MVPRPSSSPPRLASLLRRSAPFYRGPPAHKTRRDGIGYHGARGRTTPFPRRRIRKEEAPNVRVALFITCFNDTLFPETGKATVEILERLGVEVDFPLDQTCCGQMHFNTGYQREAIPLVRRFVRVFKDYEAIVAPSGSCVGAYYPHRVTYHPTCHSLRMLKVGDVPLRLLRAVKGIDYVELSEPKECCGFGGTFAVKNADTSIAMLGDKLRHVLETEAEVCCAGDNSCLMHIGGGLKRQRAGVKTVHLAEILAATEERK